MTKKSKAAQEKLKKIEEKSAAVKARAEETKGKRQIDKVNKGVKGAIGGLNPSGLGSGVIGGKEEKKDKK